MRVSPQIDSPGIPSTAAPVTSLMPDKLDCSLARHTCQSAPRTFSYSRQDSHDIHLMQMARQLTRPKGLPTW